MSTIADYSVFTKAFLTSTDVDFSKLYGNKFQGEGDTGSLRAFAVIPFKLENPLTPREAMNLDLTSDWSKFGTGNMWDRVSCRDADGNFIGNIVRIQPGVREGSIRLVAKVAIPVANEQDVADAQYNTFVLVRMDSSTGIDLPIAVATISKCYMLHKHFASGNVPLDDVENANYVSFTINHLNGYTSVDFNPDAYVTYDVTDALSRRVDVLEGKEGIEGLHLAFNSNTGDIILSDSKGNVIDQANLHLDLSADTIIAEGEEGYKYVKTDRNQDIHSAKAFMDPRQGKDGSYTSAFGEDKGKDYDTVNASLVRYKPSKPDDTHDDTHVCNGIRVRWKDSEQTSHDEIFYVCLKDGDENGGTVIGKKYLAWNSYQLSDSQLTQGDPKLFHTASGAPIEVAGDSAIYSGSTNFSGIAPVYDHDVFVHTVGNSSLKDWDKCFELMGFHDGDDIPLGTRLPALVQDMSSGKLDPERVIHGVDSQNKKDVEAQRELAKKEMAAYNSRRPTLKENRQDGTIIDHTGLDVRGGSITLGCGRIGEEGKFQKVSYGIQMKDRSSDPMDPIRNRSESLDFTVSHNTGLVKFDDNGHAVKDYADGQATNLDSSTLLSIEAGSYISGAPTCLILAKVTYNSEDNPVMFTPVRMTAGFIVAPNNETSSGLSLTIHDYRDNIKALLNPNSDITSVPAIIEIQALYTHLNAETVPAQQMHTYIGKWMYKSDGGVLMDHPECSFLCNKIEEWMTAVGLADTTPAEGVELYVVIRVY